MIPPYIFAESNMDHTPIDAAGSAASLAHRRDGAVRLKLCHGPVRLFSHKGG